MEELTTKCAKTFSQSTLRIFISQSTQSFYTEYSKDIFFTTKSTKFFISQSTQRFYTESMKYSFLTAINGINLTAKFTE